MLTLGIPGSAPAAVMLGALMTHGLKPGFDLFSEQGDIVFTYTFGLILSNFIILLLGLVLVRIFVRALNSAAFSGCGDSGAVGGWFILHQQLVDGRPVHGGLRLTRLRACAV